jgi:hypothetical protein
LTIFEPATRPDAVAGQFSLQKSAGALSWVDWHGGTYCRRGYFRSDVVLLRCDWQVLTFKVEFVRENGVWKTLEF